VSQSKDSFNFKLDTGTTENRCEHEKHALNTPVQVTECITVQSSAVRLSWQQDGAKTGDMYVTLTLQYAGHHMRHGKVQKFVESFQDGHMSADDIR
jgi:hypothetical protein